MVIQTISKRYQVIKTLSGSDLVEAWLCSGEQDNPEERYLIMGLTGKVLSKKIVPYFMEFSEKSQGGEFLDSFIQKGCLWLVFRYFEYPGLRQRMEGEFLLKERLEASRTMMERIISQNQPVYILYEALNPENVVVSDTSEVYFNYLLMEPEFLEVCRLIDVQVRLAECFEILFAPELKESISEELSWFIKGLREKQYSGYVEIYREYRALYETLEKKQQEGGLTYKGWLPGMWDKLKIFLRRIYKALYLLIIAGLIGLLIYTCLEPKVMPASRVEITQIGTLKILEETKDSSTENESREKATER